MVKGNPENKRGLKDHEIARIVNTLRDELRVLTNNESLRGRISDTLVRELGSMGLRIDK